MAELVVSIIVVPIVEVIFSKVASLLKEEIVAIKGVEEELEKLSSNLYAIRAVLEDAEEKQLDAGSKSLRDWLTKLRDAASYAEDILEIFETETFLWKRKQQVRRIHLPCSVRKLRFKSSVAHKIKKISERIDVITGERKKFHLKVSSDVHIGRPQNLPTTPLVDETEVFGRDSEKQILIEQILSNEPDAATAAAAKGGFSVLPIVGMGGLGKTTLAQLIFNDANVKKKFEIRMWVCVTAEFDYHKIVKGMLESHTKLDLSNLSLSTLESRFKEEMSGQEFLLVLDDVWTEDTEKWDKLKTLLSIGSQGNRVLVTTRIERVSEIFGTQPSCTLQVLSDEESWSLFKKTAFKDCDNLGGGLMKELEEIGWEIVKKCKGLPLAVRVMGGLLRGDVNVNKWKQILNSSIWELDEKTDKDNFDRPRVLPALKLSYDHLPSNLKQCFAYCSMFPKAYVFDKKELVKLWMAESFIIQSSSGLSVEESGVVVYFDELLTRSFFQHFKIDEKERYRMHDLIHELALAVSTPQCCQVNHDIDNNSPAFSEKSLHVSLLCADLEKPASRIIEESDEKLRLRTLLLPGEDSRSFGKADLDKMFRCLNYIRVLDLSSSGLLELPSSVEELKLLRYLDLSRNEIKELPDSICNLTKLQTLKLLGCAWLFKLPDDIGNMVNLHFLELDDMFWYKCRTLPPSIGKLTRLRNLHEYPVTGATGHGIEELKGMANLTGTLHILNLENAVNAAKAKLNEKERLLKLVLEWSNKIYSQKDEAKAESDLKDLQPHSNIKELALYHFKGSHFPSWMADGALQNMVSLTLSHCTKCTSVLSLSQSPRLRELYIKGMLELEEWQDAEQPLLRRLYIINCPKLRKVPNLLPYLKHMKIKKCSSLEALPMTPSLETLIVSDNLVLENWNEGFCTFENDQPRPTLIGLLDLKVENCPNIQALPLQFFPEKLEICGCEHITALPTAHLAPEFLKHLALKSRSNGTLVRAIPSANSLFSLVISNISNLTSFPKLPHLPKLETLYINDCEDLTSLSEEEESLKSLSSLKSLFVQRCPKLDSFPDEGLPTNLEYLEISSCGILKSLGSKQTLKSLLSLEDLCLENCPLIRCFPEDGLSASLQHLKIHDCDLLTEQCQENAAEWPKIMHVKDLEIGCIKAPSASSQAPNLPKKKNHFSLFGCV